jgi:hypothetical protein
MAFCLRSCECRPGGGVRPACLRHLTYRPALSPPRGRTWPRSGRRVDHPDQHGRRRRWAADEVPGSWRAPTGSRAHRTRPTPITTRHFAPRVRVFGRFAAPSPSFPLVSVALGGQVRVRGPRGHARDARWHRSAAGAGCEWRPPLAAVPSWVVVGHTGAHVRPRGGAGGGW